MALVTHPNPEEHAMTMTDVETKAFWAAQVAQFEAEAKVAWPSLVAQMKERGDARLTPVQTGAGVGVIAVQASYGHADEAAVLAGQAEPIAIVATQDGRHYDRQGWHQGPSDIETWVYFERYEAGLRVAHGYLDPTTRKITQSG